MPGGEYIANISPWLIAGAPAPGATLARPHRSEHEARAILTYEILTHGEFEDMQTNIEIDDRLMRQAMRCSRAQRSTCPRYRFANSDHFLVNSIIAISGGQL